MQCTLFRNILCIRYEDVDRHQLYRNGAIPLLKLWGIDGTVIHVNSSAFDTGPVIDGIYRHRLDHDGPDHARFRNPPEPVP